MLIKDISNVSFAGASMLFFFIGADLLAAKDYLAGVAFVLLSLGLLVARELLKKKLGVEIKSKK